MLHSALHPGYSAANGTGVVAVRDIPMGTALWGPCPRCRVWSAEEERRTPSAVVAWVDEYGYRAEDLRLLLPCGGAHLLNHGCEASVLDHGLDAGIAVRDIRAGEEVTCDYRTFRYDGPWEFTCRCGAAGCVGTVRSAPQPPATVVADWQRRMAAALPAVSRVPQELRVGRGSVTTVPVSELVLSEGKP